MGYFVQNFGEIESTPWLMPHIPDMDLIPYVHPSVHHQEEGGYSRRCGEGRKGEEGENGGRGEGRGEGGMDKQTDG